LLEELAVVVLEQIGRSTGLRYGPVERTILGESQTTFMVRAGDERLVLKLEPASRTQAHRNAARTCEYLSAAGYPAPRTVAMGILSDHAFALRTCLPGASMTPEDGGRHVGRLLSLLDLHRDAAEAAGLAPGLWPESVVAPVLSGGAGYCLLETMRGHSRESSDLLDALQSLVFANRASLPGARDIMHYDFNPANILVDSGGVSGVVDWEGVRAGDHAFDLATMLFYTYDAAEARTALWRRSRELRPASVFSVYMAHVVLRQVEWSLRMHAPAIGRGYLDRAHRVLSDLEVQLA